MTWIEKYTPYLLLIIVLFAFVIRLVWLDRSPRGLLIDEAHFGYISYSLLKTGQDEHGVSYPLIFKGFGDQKLPVQVYLLMPIIKLFGLNALAVRLPSVMAGTIFVLLIYFLVKEFGLSKTSSLLTALIAAVIPWSFILSRFAYESNLALVWFTLGLICLIKVIKSPAKMWSFLMALFFGLTWYTYVAYRPITLLLGFGFLGLMLILKKISWSNLAVFGLSFSLIILPLFQARYLGAGAARFNQVGIFSDEGLVMEINEDRTFCDVLLPKSWCYLLWNKPTVYLKELLHRFANVYSANFMLLDGDIKLIYQSVDKFGQFYLFLAPVIFLGLVATLFQTSSLKLSAWQRWLIILGLLITPISSVLAGEAQMVRLSALLPLMLLLVGLGLEFIYQFLSQGRWQMVFLGILSLLLANTASFLTNFYTIHTVKYDQVYESYLPELFDYLATLPADAQIYLKPFFSDPIMAYAYYQQVDPAWYQQHVKLGKLEASGFQHAVELDNYLVSEDPMINLGCQAVKDDIQAYYVTNEEFKNPIIEYVYKVNSTNGSLGYAYIYDASGYARSQAKLCL